MLNNGATSVEHYLDEYFTCGPQDSNICYTNLDTMLAICQKLGFSVQPSKVVKPTTCIEFLGIIIDSSKMELRISQERMAAVLKELKMFKRKHTCHKRELLSLIGKLTFVSKVVRPGRIFTRRLIELSKKLKHLHHRIRVNKNALQDIQWWLDYLCQWNRTSVFYDANWTSNADLHLWSDASDHGYAAIYGNQWIYETFDRGRDQSQDLNIIAWRELLAIVKAAATWGKTFMGKKVLFHCDNMTVVHVINNGTSTNVMIMDLIRSLYFICAQFNFECAAEHVPGLQNEGADALSRGRIEEFRTLHPTANLIKTVAGQLPFNKYV